MITLLGATSPFQVYTDAAVAVSQPANLFKNQPVPAVAKDTKNTGKGGDSTGGPQAALAGNMNIILLLSGIGIILYTWLGRKKR